MLKKFLVQIWAYDHHAKFEVLAEDSATSIEESILDKLGEKSIKWESTGMFKNMPRRITYEGLVMTEDLYKQKRSLELRWQLEYEQNGKYTLNMVEIDNTIKGIITEIKLEERRIADVENAVQNSAPQVSVAT